MGRRAVGAGRPPDEGGGEAPGQPDEDEAQDVVDDWGLAVGRHGYCDVSPSAGDIAWSADEGRTGLQYRGTGGLVSRGGTSFSASQRSGGLRTCGGFAAGPGSRR